MLAHRSILIAAFVLAGALSALAQSPEPQPTAPTATTRPAAEPDATSATTPTPKATDPANEAISTIPAGEAVVNPGLPDAAGSETAEPRRQDEPGEPVDTTTKAADTPSASDRAIASPSAAEAPVGAASSGGASNTTPPTSGEQPAAPPPSATLQATPTLAVDTGAGAFAQAYEQVVLEPFSAKTGIKVSATHADRLSGDQLLLDGSELARRCTSGELVKLDLAALSPASTSPAAPDDYLDGALKPCGIAALAWSNVFVYDPAKFEKRAPRTLADMFDTRRYPGKRALPHDGRGLMEAVLVADGVAASDVYNVLDTSEGINRILKKLKSLGADIVWYDRLPEAIALVRDGKATIAFTSNGHAFIEQARNGPIGVIWDGQILHPSYFAIPKSASNEALAKELIAFAFRPEQLVGLVRQIPYGPMRHSAIAASLGVRHVVTGQEIGPFLPTAPENLRTAVWFDPVWWEANAERIETALHIVRQGPPLPQRP